MKEKDVAQLYPLLTKSPLFRGMEEGEITRALTLLAAHRRTYGKGEYLHRMGEPLAAFGLVLSGTVQVYTDDFEGNRMMMANVSTGGTFGESLCFLAVPAAPVHILSGNGAEVLWLHTAALRQGSADPFTVRIVDRFTAMLAARALDMNERIQILSKHTLREKICTFLSEWERRTGSKTFTVPFDRAALADYLGADRAALSRELSRMQGEGIIEYYKNTFKIC